MKGAMAKLLPFPLMSMAITVMWLLLTGFSSGHALLAILVGLALPRVMLLLGPDPANIRFGPAMLQLAGVVLVDIIRSNIAVGRIILTPTPARRSGFIEIPLDITSRYALSVLAIILTATPGTLWVQYDPGRHYLLLHVLDLVDEKAWIDLIKNRYERLLMEIFQ